jgi:hypothetical protein
MYVDTHKPGHKLRGAYDGAEKQELVLVSCSWATAYEGFDLVVSDWFVNLASNKTSDQKQSSWNKRGWHSCIHMSESEPPLLCIEPFAVSIGDRFP